jgi:hypothetical protein
MEGIEHPGHDCPEGNHDKKSGYFGHDRQPLQNSQKKNRFLSPERTLSAEDGKSSSGALSAVNPILLNNDPGEH